MNRANKKQWITNLKSTLEQSESIVLARIKGLKVSSLDKLRSIAFERGVKVLVLKNTLAKIAVQDTDFAAVQDLFEDQIVAFISQNEVDAAWVTKAFTEFKQNIETVGGALRGQALKPEEIEELSSVDMASLRSKILSMLLSQPQLLISILMQPAQSIIRVITARCES